MSTHLDVCPRCGANIQGIHWHGRGCRGNPDLRFWSRVAVGQSDECWPWLGSRDPQGYGHLRACGEYVTAHRFAYRLAVEPIPDGMFVCHHCDNPPCVNPAHLFLGTNAENVHDAMAKGLMRRAGEENPNAKLRDVDVLAIRARAAAGETQGRIAAEFGLTRGWVNAIVRRRRWAHLDAQMAP